MRKQGIRRTKNKYYIRSIYIIPGITYFEVVFHSPSDEK